MMTEQRVTVTITDGVADVRLNRPEKRNALDNAMFAGLITAGERLKTEPGVRAVVLSGEGPDFCAGLDFGAFQAMRDGRPAPSARRSQGHRAARRARLGRTARPGHRGGDRQRPGRWPADRARR
jgi:enoyl-CoA hydratase/carnithine racemase